MNERDEKKAKAVPLKANVPAVKSAKVPAPKVKREWRDFDDFVELAKKIKFHIEDQWKRVYAIDDEDGPPPSPVALANAMCILRTSDHDPARKGRLVKEFDEQLDYFERDDLYEPIKGKKLTPDLLGCHDDRVITRRIVCEQVGLLIGSFPNAGPHSPEVYTRMLIEEIIAAKLSPVALEACCREIRRTKTFVPSVAEVLTVLRFRMEEWQSLRTEIIDWDRAYWLKILSRKLEEAKKKWPEIAREAEKLDALSRERKTLS